MIYQLNSFLVKEFEKHQAMKRDLGIGSYLVYTLGFWTKALQYIKKAYLSGFGLCAYPWGFLQGS